jgi:hypothetical protein
LQICTSELIAKQMTDDLEVTVICGLNIDSILCHL